MFKKGFYIVFFFQCLAVISCDFYKEDRQDGAVARVNDNYLYADDIEKLLPENVSSEDSVQIVTSYINNWASNLLLLDNAKLNLEEDKQDRFEQLVNQYRIDLYTKSYLEALVKKNMDTSVNSAEAKAYFQSNKESFKLNDELLQLRYISLPQNTINLSDIKTRFQRFNEEDKSVLDSISTQFKAYSFNDSIWVRASQVLEKVPALNTENKDQLLKKSNFIQLKDSLNLYLMQINNVLLRNDYAPLEYVKPSIKQIVINKRKLELIKQLENDIRTDAIKNKQFEVFN